MSYRERERVWRRGVGMSDGKRQRTTAEVVGRRHFDGFGFEVRTR